MKAHIFINKMTAALLLLLVMSCRSTKVDNNNIILLKSEKEAKPIEVKTGNIQEQNIKLKYAGILSVPPDSIKNVRLYNFIDSWMNTPYLWGGTTRQGIDCSAFIQRLLADVYDIHIPRTSIQQFFTDNVEPFGSRHYLREGDLVFFTTDKDKLISHVGMYLNNRLFVNASSTYGVSIANMDKSYWRRCYVASGRMIVHKKS